MKCVDCPREARVPRAGRGPGPKRCAECQEGFRRARSRESTRRYRITHPQYRTSEQIRLRNERRRADPVMVEKDRAYSRRVNREHPERRHDNHLRHAYGFSRWEFEEMLERQHGLCALCSVPLPIDRNPSVDHDHVTGQVRGLLCATCNFRLGFIEKTPPDWFDRALVYVGADPIGRAYIAAGAVPEAVLETVERMVANG